MIRKIVLTVLAALLLVSVIGFAQDREVTSFEVVSIRRVQAVDPDRVGKYDLLVMYELDSRGSYIVRIPEEEFTEELMVRAIQEDIALGRGLVGKPYPIE